MDLLQQCPKEELKLVLAAKRDDDDVVPHLGVTKRPSAQFRSLAIRPRVLALPAPVSSQLSSRIGVGWHSGTFDLSPLRDVRCENTAHVPLTVDGA